MANKIRTRFAPSPTGYLHVGGLRTALFNFLWARKNQGMFILRIEDTDRERYVADAQEKIVKILKDFSLVPDEGPGIGGDMGPYVQSERLDLYKEYSDELVSSGQADKEETEKGTAIRFKLKKTGITEYDDEVYGKLQFKNELLKDPVILKSDGYPVYNFANVIDDHLMEITHVIRGEEFLSSTPMHIQMYQALSWEPPKYAHVPLILDSDRKKLSKRTGDVAVEEYQKKGYLKEALLNFMALLGWNPKTTDEVFGLEQLIKEFDLKKLNKSGAIFDLSKLDYLNREWKKKLVVQSKDDPLFAIAKKVLETKIAATDKVDDNFLAAVWPQIEQRIPGPSKLEDYISEFDFYFTEPEYKDVPLIWKKSTPEKTLEHLKKLKEFIDSNSSLAKDEVKLEAAVKNYLTNEKISTGDALWPLRVALTGKDRSPSPFEIIAIFYKADKGFMIGERIDRAIRFLEHETNH